MIKLLLLPALLLITLLHVKATHFKGGEITIKGTTVPTVYAVTLILYLDSTNVVNAGGALDELSAEINFGDGTSEIVPLNLRTYIGNNTIKSQYFVSHTYSGKQLFIVSYTQDNRKKYIVNIDGISGNTTDQLKFYISATLNTSIFDEAGTPQFSGNHPGVARPGIIFTYASGALPAVAGDSVSYELVSPKINAANNVPSYISPADPSFNGTNVVGGPPTFLISPATGLLTWNAPSAYTPAQSDYAFYNVGVLVTEWRKNSGTYVSVGSTVRDILIEVNGSATGVHASYEKMIRVYPNPVTTSFELNTELDQLKNATMTIYSSQGQLIKSVSFISTFQIFSMEEFASGFYTIIVSDGKGSWHSTLVKQ